MNTTNIIRYGKRQPPKGVLKNSCSANMQQLYRRTPITKCDFNKYHNTMRVDDHISIAYTCFESNNRALGISGKCNIRSSRPEVSSRKGFLKICSKCTGEHPCRSAISIKLLLNFIEITLQHGYSPINLLHYFRTPILENTSGRLLLILHFP